MTITITMIIIGITCLVSLIAFQNEELKAKFLFYPVDIKNNNQYYRFLTSGFIHSDLMHLFFNMFVLYSFGNKIEYLFINKFGTLGIVSDALGGDRATNIVSALLRSGAFRSRLTKQVNRAAEKGAEIAAPMVTEAIQSISIADALSVVKGGTSAATDLLKGQMGTALITAMVPGIDGGLKLFDSAIVTEALKLATGINFAGLRDDVTQKASDAIYRTMAREEASIRANPQGTNDPLLIGVFGLLK